MGKGQYVTFFVESNAQDFADFMGKVPEKIQLDIETKIPVLRRNTKKTVQNQLYKKHGMDKGIYRKSFIINNFAESKWHIGFQVFAKKPHYRLTHLLEEGHKSKVFKKGRGERTKWGNVGMVDIGRRGLNRKGASQHIAEGQSYAEKKVVDLYDEAKDRALGERLKKL